MTAEFRLLGDVELSVGGRLVDAGHARQRYVLAALLAEPNRVVPTGQLIGQVWGEQRLPARPAGTLQTYVSLLRRALRAAEDVAIAWQSPGYKVIADVQAIDLHRFRTLVSRAGSAGEDEAAVLLTRAVGLWRGEPLAGLDTPWALGLRATLAMQLQAARFDLTDLRLRRGEHAALLADLAVQARDEPLDERTAGQFMLALYRNGRPADALRHYQSVRHKLASELGTGPAAPLRELHQRILTADPDLDVRLRVRAVADSARHPQPRQLPAPPRRFSGRTAELDRLSAALEPARICAIGGAGGTGKSWLALHWAYRHLDRFPDGQLWVDLRGFGPSGEPMPPETALRGFLAALGADPALVPADMDAQAGMYRSLMAGKRMLVVLDNTSDTSQAVPLLPGSPGCTVLVTSRRKLTGLVAGYGAAAMDIGMLTEDEAMDLLACHLGPARMAAEPGAVETLLACCGGLPLALAVTAARAAARPEFPLGALAEELRDAATRLDALETADVPASVRTALSSSCRALDPPAATMFGLLGLAPGPDISLAAAASLRGLPEPRARATLRDLAAVFLVQEHVPGRYRMHDLVRLYAAEQAGHTQATRARAAALRRVTGFYLHTAYAADRILAPQRPPARLGKPPAGCVPSRLPGEDAALAWLAAEHPCLLAAQQLAARQGWHELAWQLAWTLSTFHRRRGLASDWVATWEAGLTAASQLSRPAAVGTAHALLGFACVHAGDQAKALFHLDQALAMAQQAGNLASQAHVHLFLSVAWARQRDHRRALQHAARAKSLFHALGDTAWEAEALSAAGAHHASLGEPGAARAACEAALALHRGQRFEEGEARTLDILGHIASHEGRHAQALAYHQLAIDRYRHLGDTGRQAGAQAALAQSYAARGQHDQAHDAWRQADELRRSRPGQP